MIRNLCNYKVLTSRLKICSSIVRYYTSSLETNFTESDKVKILKVLNEDISSLSRYDVAKSRVKKLTEYLGKNGGVRTISEIENIDGFSVKVTEKLFSSILNGPKENDNISKKIKGQILQPLLSENYRQSCKSVLAIYVTVNSVCWTHIQRNEYMVDEWRYHQIDYPDGKKMQITDILNMAWNITNVMPKADLYVMKAEATTLRASGSDPNNPKVIAVNLQKAQLVAMMVALLNAKQRYLFDSVEDEGEESKDKTEQLKQTVYFLRPTLPFRLYGTLVGNERVSTDPIVEQILRESSLRKSNNHVSVPEDLVNKYRSQNELQKDMLGQCLLLALTFMDICIYKDRDSINKLLKRGE